MEHLFNNFFLVGLMSCLYFPRLTLFDWVDHVYLCLTLIKLLVNLGIYKMSICVASPIQNTSFYIVASEGIISKYFLGTTFQIKYFVFFKKNHLCNKPQDPIPCKRSVTSKSLFIKTIKWSTLSVQSFGFTRFFYKRIFTSVSYLKKTVEIGKTSFWYYFCLRKLCEM
jgi:hypothetical protein